MRIAIKKPCLIFVFRVLEYLQRKIFIIKMPPLDCGNTEDRCHMRISPSVSQVELEGHNGLISAASYVTLP